MLHLTVTWDLVFTGKDINHNTCDCDLQVGALIMLHLTVTWDLLFKGKGLNHATFAVT